MLKMVPERRFYLMYHNSDVIIFILYSKDTNTPRNPVFMRGF